MGKIDERIEDLKTKVADFPQTPGVYLMKSQQGKIIYVGKAKRLRARVRSYLNPNLEHSKTVLLVRNIFTIDYILTDTEAEAFLLEASLIKKHRPRYNIRLKDDRAYPYIRLSLADEFPRFYLARKVKKDGSHYYGPYTSGYVVRDTIRFLNQSYQIRDCSDHFMKSRKRPCMTHQIGACTAPCVGLITEKEYKKDVKQASRFLEEESHEVVEQLKNKMMKLADEEKFELAAKYRDSIAAIERVLEKQSVVNSKSTNNQDVIGFYGDERGTLVETLHIRHGRVIGQRSQFFTQINTKDTGEDPREWLTSFITQYYQDNIVPDEIFLPIDLGFDIIKLMKEVFAFRGHTAVEVRFPATSQGQQLLDLANKNAESHFQRYVSKSEKKKQGLEMIRKKLHLKEVPQRIECFDISHFQGAETVGSQVVAESGVLNKDHYRRYKLKAKTGGDDYAALREVLTRRLAHEEWDEPDLLIIDGGKGQLNAAFSVLKDIGKAYIPVAGLAKERTQRNFKGARVEKTMERFYLPGRQNPVTFAEGSEAFQILIGLRDEAHRFAIQFHRKLRDDQSLKSRLDSVKGLGDTLKKRLLKHFDSVEAITNSNYLEIAEVQGVSEKLAKSILSHLQSLDGSENDPSLENK
ncbi:MAG: excinuclease ABC subunit UvrC [Bdellovibrionales bacterium]|nr:excinuclease ABC subunit UvrC [Bdellovibrionales bacterium]